MLFRSNAVADPGALDVSRLFERFYRADAARVQSSAGLGLAVVKSLAAAQGIEATAALQGDVLSIALEFPFSGTDSQQVPPARRLP